MFVYALDAPLHETLEQHGVASYHPGGINLGEVVHKFSQGNFPNIVFWKSAVVHDVLSMGFDVLYQDIDIVWQSSPLPYFRARLLARSEVDMFFSYDGGNPHQQPIYANAGFFFVRQSNRSRTFWQEAYACASSMNSQQAILRPLLLQHYFNNNLRLHILGPRFVGGHQLDLNGPSSTNPIPRDWIIAHASWTFNATQKVAKLTGIGEWDGACVARGLQKASAGTRADSAWLYES